ncbi:MAG: PA14 domain-containing protein, partial [Planctomycetota bacterium]
MTMPSRNGFLKCSLAALAAIALPTSTLHAQDVADDRVAPDVEFQPGVSLELFQGPTPDDKGIEVANGTWTYLPVLLEGQTPNVSVVVDRIAIESDGIEGMTVCYVAEFTANLQIDEPGNYQFLLTSDDGSQFWINDEMIIDHGMAHGMTSKAGAIDLEAGQHAIRVSYFQALGGQGLSLEWQPPSATEFGVIPNDRLTTEAGLTRVVSPGPKRFAPAGKMPRPGDGRPLVDMHPMWRVTSLVTPFTEKNFPDVFEPKMTGMAYLGDNQLVATVFDPRNAVPKSNKPNGKLYLIEGVDDPADIWTDASVDLSAAPILRGPDERERIAREVDKQLEKRRASEALKNRTDVEPNAVEIKATVIAEGFTNPLGVLAHEGSLYVADRDAITRLADTDGDGSYDLREVVASGWKSDNYHHFTFGPIIRDGYLYATLSTAVGHHGHKVTEWPTFGITPNGPHRGSVLELNLETGEIDWIAGGFRTPNGLFLHEGELFVGDNQGGWLPANELNHIRPGRFYGHYNGRYVTNLYPEGTSLSDFSDEPITPPAVYLPTSQIANSPTDGVTLTDGPFAGHLLMSDVKLGGLRRIVLEEVNGELQGVALRHSQGFSVGLNRLAWGKDGSLLVGGIGERRSWSWKRTQQGLQRLDPTGETAFEIHSVSALPDGLRVRFT